MTGVLHPIGPEPERTYWLRRVVLLAVVVILVGGLIAFGSTLGRGPARAADSPLETSASATPTGAPTPTATTTPSASPTSTPSDTPSEKASEKAVDKKSSEPTSSAKSSPSERASLSASPTSTPTSAAPALCAPSQLAAKVTGDRSLKVDQDTTFTVALTNRASTTCTLAVAPSTFELKVYSGTDRIWSTKDCATAIKPTAAILKAGQVMTLRETWNGQRSAASCKKGQSLPRPGVYWATAQYAGAKPTQLRMIIS